MHTLFEVQPEHPCLHRAQSVLKGLLPIGLQALEGGRRMASDAFFTVHSMLLMPEQPLLLAEIP